MTFVRLNPPSGVAGLPWKTKGNMTTKLRWLVALSFILPLALFAQTTDAGGKAPVAPALSILQALIPLLVPVLIALVKWFVPQIPKPLLPWLAPVFGMLVGWIDNAAGVSGSNVILSAVLGAAGVAVREAFDQAKKGMAPAASAILLLLLPVMTLSMACRSLDPEGVYAGDKILYTAEKATVDGYDTLHAFVKFEAENRAALPREATAAADNIRTNAERWVRSAQLARDAYVAVKSEPNRLKLKQSLVILRAAIADALRYLPEEKKNALNTFQRTGGGESAASNRRELVKDKCATVTTADFLLPLPGDAVGEEPIGIGQQANLSAITKHEGAGSNIAGKARVGLDAQVTVDRCTPLSVVLVDSFDAAFSRPRVGVRVELQQAGPAMPSASPAQFSLAV